MLSRIELTKSWVSPNSHKDAQSCSLCCHTSSIWDSVMNCSLLQLFPRPACNYYWEDDMGNFSQSAAHSHPKFNMAWTQHMVFFASSSERRWARDSGLMQRRKLREKRQKKGAIFILPDACKCLCLKIFFFLTLSKLHSHAFQMRELTCHKLNYLPS